MKHNNKGFSLVELIVVIAIMAVLAAVAVIGVSIYIPKAQEAADNELLNVLTDALVAACLSEGVDQRDVVAEIKVNDDGSLDRDRTTGKVKIDLAPAAGKTLSATAEAKIADMFNQIFTDNTAFNVVKGAAVRFNGTQFVWQEVAGLPLTYTFNGKEYIVESTDRDALLGSIFADPNVMTPGDLVTNVDAVVDFAAGKVNTNSLLSGLVQEQSFQEVFAAMYPGLDINDPNNNEQKMSALVVYTAQNSQDLNNQDVYDAIIANKGGYGYIANANSNDTQDVATMAMHYALGMAWAKENNIDYNDDPAKLFELMSKQEDVLDEDNNPTGQKKDSAFVDWLKNEGKDTAMDAMDGYKGAMNIIGSNSGNIKGDELYDENGEYAGFGSYEDLIEQVMGQGS